MIKIQVIKKLEYRKCPIYIRRLDRLFEYIIIYNNQLYSSYIDVRLKWYQRDYTKKQLEDIVKLLYFSACQTIDKLKKTNKKK